MGKPEYVLLRNRQFHSRDRSPPWGDDGAQVAGFVVGVNSGGLGLLLIVVACPLMMFFMMRTMGDMNHKDNSDHDPEHRV